MTTDENINHPTPPEQSKSDDNVRKQFTFAPRSDIGDQPVERILAAGQKRKKLGIGLMVGIGILSAIILSFVSLTAEEDIKVQVASQDPQPQQSGSLELGGLKYKGVTAEGNDFIVLAKSAIESPELPNQISLTAPRARVDGTSGNPMTIRSNEGQFYRDNKRVDLNGRVVIVRPDIGYTLMTEAAIAHLDTGLLTSDNIVRGFSPRARVKADGMVISQNGKDVLFKGKSRLTITPSSENN